jgi:Acetokinase family
MMSAVTTLRMGCEFDRFLYASVGNDSDGMPLTVLSALERMDVDPWASKLTQLSQESAVTELASLLGAFRNAPVVGLDPARVSASLIALLPRARDRAPLMLKALVQAAPTKYPAAVSTLLTLLTYMGLTPTGGIIMGTRSGDLDPGVLVYLARQKKLDAGQLEELVDRRSGLLGLSGVSADLRELHKVAHANTDARLAIHMFCYSAAKELAAMSAALGSVDTIVFTGGIGENDAQVRALICGHLGVFGVRLDAARNLNAGDPISAGVSRCSVRVLPSQEDEQIARQAWTLSPGVRN